MDSISDHAENLLKGCDELSEKLKASKSSSSLLIAQMQQLQEKKKTIDKKQDVVQKILFQFQLSKSEQDVLHAESKNGFYFVSVFIYLKVTLIWMKPSFLFLKKFTLLNIVVEN